MARVAFVMDKPLRKIGLSGRSVVPMLIGFGCSVPAIMATRTVSSDRDRKMTILLTPYMSCSAKISIYAFFTAAFFPRYRALVMLGLYVLGILIGIIAALIMNKTAPLPTAKPLPVCHRKLPELTVSAQRAQRGADAVGEGEGLSPARVHGHFSGHDHHLVPPEL